MYSKEVPIEDLTNTTEDAIYQEKGCVKQENGKIYLRNSWRRSFQLAGLNITQKAVSRMETGKRVIADYELPYLADVLDVTILFPLLGMEEIQRADNYIS